MKILSTESLPGLPVEIKNLISDGVYALFSIKHEHGTYALIISDNNPIYILNNDGHIVSIFDHANLSKLEVIEPITFINAGNKTIRINAA